MQIQMLEELVKELEKKTWQGNQAQPSLGKKGRRVYEEGAGRGGDFEEEGGLLLKEEGGNQGHDGPMVWWEPMVLQGSLDLEEVVFQALSPQALTRCLSFVLYMCN
jgi:hypothetical protein